jgi:hypothetical protein
MLINNQHCIQTAENQSTPDQPNPAVLLRKQYRDSKDTALAETEPTAAHADDLSQQQSHMSTYPRDKALAETEPTAAHSVPSPTNSSTCDNNSRFSNTRSRDIASSLTIEELGDSGILFFS